MIAARNLAYAYPGGREALRGIDLDVAAGERVAVLGPNGAGKTTLMLALKGLLRAAGELRVDAEVGLVFQDPDDQLFMPTVEEDVAFGPLNQGLERPEVHARVREALEAVRMDGAAERAPQQLSMGERRRVAIAGVLAMRPSLLVLDEPSANLDPRGRRELVEILAALPTTMLLTTHDLPLAAELCERSVILAGGRVVGDGATLELLDDEALLAAHDLELPNGFVLSSVDRRYPTPQ